MAKKKSRKASPKKSNWLTTSIAFVVIALIAFFNFHNGDLKLSRVWEWLGHHNTAVPETRTATVPIPKAPDAVRIGTFNIQVFGQSKLGKPEVMAVLADVARQFDVLAIQEIRTQDDAHVDKFLQMVNASGRRFDKIVGPRLGRTSSTEQYAFVFDTETIAFIPGSAFTIQDPYDQLHREPLVAGFQVRSQTGRGFSFQLINIHTDPDETKQELDALGDVFAIVQQQRRDDDVIVVGDLNVSPEKFGRLGYQPGITPVVTTQFTNTRGNATLDNIVFDRRPTIEFLSRGGVMDLREMYSLSQEQVLEISDHLPVWADFSKYEGSPGTIAANPDGEAF